MEFFGNKKLRVLRLSSLKILKHSTTHISGVLYALTGRIITNERNNTREIETIPIWFGADFDPHYGQWNFRNFRLENDYTEERTKREGYDFSRLHIYNLELLQIARYMIENNIGSFNAHDFGRLSVEILVEYGLWNSYLVKSSYETYMVYLSELQPQTA